MNAVSVEPRTRNLTWWKPGPYRQKIDVLPPLVVVFLQFKMCKRFPRHMYKNMDLLSIAVFAH